MRSDLTIEQKRLADFMSRISEKCYSAVWMANLEYILWNAVKLGEIKYGRESISEVEIKELIK